MKNLFEINFAGINLSNPVVIGSSGLTNTAEKNKDLEKAGAGALVLKSLFEEQILMQSDTMINKTTNHRSKVNDHIQNYIKKNRISDYLELIQESKQQCTIPVIASINCFHPDSWADFAHQIERGSFMKYFSNRN